MSIKKLHSEERKEPYNALNRTNKTVQEPNEKKAKGKKRNTLTSMSPIKVVKQQQIESLWTDSLVTEDFSKVPKRSAHNRKQSYQVLNRAKPLRRIAV